MSQIIKGIKRIQYDSFQIQQLLLSNITARSDWVSDIIRNGIIGIFGKGASVTGCDLEAQLRGMTICLLDIDFLFLESSEF